MTDHDRELEELQNSLAEVSSRLAQVRTILEILETNWRAQAAIQEGMASSVFLVCANELAEVLALNSPENAE